MHIRTLANRTFRHKGFVYDRETFDEKGEVLELHVRARKNSKPICSRCGNPGSIYDHRSVRRFSMVPIWGLAVVLIYQMRRVNCRHCGKVTTERVPWSIGGKSPLTTAFAHFLASWARLLSWDEVAHRCGTTWDMVAESVKYVVTWGLAHRDLAGATAIGVDEIQYHDGHKYLTLVYQINQECRRLLWVGYSRTAETLDGFFQMIGPEAEQIEVVCSDMWAGYLDSIKRNAGNALNVLDRFHIVQHLGKAIDQTRRDEVKQLRERGFPAYLAKARWILLKRKERQTEPQRIRLRKLVKLNLTTVKAYLAKEAFDRLWSYVSPIWAGRFIDQWCADVQREPDLIHLHSFTKMLQRHRDLILNYWRTKKEFSSGVVEGFNGKAKLCIRKSFGFRTDKYREFALFHALGRLPEPEATHRFA